MSSSTNSAWWSATVARPGRAKLLAVVVTVGLLAVSAFVWSSPAPEIARIGAAAVSPLTQLNEKNDALTKKMARLEKQLATTKKELASGTGKVQSLQARGDDLKAQLDQAEAQLAEARSQLASATAKGSATTAGKTGAVPGPKSAGAGASAPITALSREQIVNPANPWFGLYTDQSPFNMSAVDNVSAKVGSYPGVVGFFAGWDQDFRASGVTAAWKRGMVPLMTWESRPIDAPNSQETDPNYTLAKIIDGTYDDYIRRFAQQATATGLPFILRLDHEMNGAWYPWSQLTNGNSAGQYVQMWQHVHDIFEQEGANRYAIWLWAPNRVEGVPNAARSTAYTRSLYPGDSYVDLVGMSGYYRRNQPSVSFATTFATTLAQLRTIAPGKKIFLGEVGATSTGGNKAAWITSFFQGMNDPANDDIIGFAWFDLVATSDAEGDDNTNDWRIESSPDAVAAFKNGLAAPGSRFVLTPPSG